jgi:hypothetical protein
VIRIKARSQIRDWIDKSVKPGDNWASFSLIGQVPKRMSWIARINQFLEKFGYSVFRFCSINPSEKSDHLIVGLNFNKNG